MCDIKVKNLMKNNSVFIGRWLYSKPDLIVNKDGNIILISKVSFGPLEVYKWGIDSGGIPFECYKWLENDFFEDENYFKNIEKEELIRQINSVVSLFRSNELPEWADIYEKIIRNLNQNLFL